MAGSSHAPIGEMPANKRDFVDTKLGLSADHCSAVGGRHNERESAQPPSRGMAGDLIIEGNDLYGHGGNIVACLKSEAPAGGLWQSRNCCFDVEAVRERKVLSGLQP